VSARIVPEGPDRDLLDQNAYAKLPPGNIPKLLALVDEACEQALAFAETRTDDCIAVLFGAKRPDGTSRAHTAAARAQWRCESRDALLSYGEDGEIQFVTM
jgi:hypothetical protein